MEFENKNVGLCFSRRNKDTCFITDKIAMSHLLGEGCFISPLYIQVKEGERDLFQEKERKNGRDKNLS